MGSDFYKDIVVPEDFIGRKWKCFFCGAEVEVTDKGISHSSGVSLSESGKGYHWQQYSLDDLMNLKLFNDELEKKEHKIWFYGTKQIRGKGRSKDIG